MTELEIHIRTRPPLTAFTTETLSDKSGLVIRLCPLPALPASSSRMQQQIHKMDSVSEDLFENDDILEEVEEEDSSNNDVFGMTTCASMPSLVPQTTSSTPIAIPNSNNSMTNSHHASASTPPHHHNYLCRVSPWASCEVNSPTSLSSGYGSSPSRLFITASTQTSPPPSYNTFDIRLRFTNSPVNSPMRSPMADIRRAQLRRQILQNSGSERRPRYHSEGSGTDAVQAAEIESDASSTDPSQPLPDLINTAFRPRSNTEPSRPRPEIMVGEQLRRISDEFHLSYEEVRRLRRRRAHQGWLSRVIEHFRGGPHHEVVEEERPQADKNVCVQNQQH